MIENYARFRYDGRPVGEPFESAEEAVLWSLRCQAARDDGARVVAGLGLVVRPCDPDDIGRMIRHLCKKKILNSHHMGILNRYGRRMAMGGYVGGNAPRAAHLWAQILSSLSPELQVRGVIR